MSSEGIVNIIKRFDNFTQNRANFLEVQSDSKEEYKKFVKSLYDYTKSEEDINGKSKSSALPNLIVEEFDEEQIWQQIELQNDGIWDQLVSDVASCLAVKDSLTFPIKFENEKRDIEDQDHSDKDSGEDDEDDLDKEYVAQEIVPKEKKKRARRQKAAINGKQSTNTKKSIVDDTFFKLDEMEQFLLSEERKIEKPSRDSDEESVDYFEGDDNDDDEEDDEDRDAMYDQFFEADDYVENKNKNFDDKDIEDEDYEDDQELVDDDARADLKKQVRFTGIADTSSSDDDDTEETQGPKSLDKQSEFEQRQLRLKQHITRLENKTLQEAPWQLKGEVDAKKRPENSLLEEVVDFDLTSRPAPIITEQTTITLEELILRRIKDKAWDDVVRKAKPVDDQLAFKKPEILDQSKSKMSLAQVYEAEYLKQKHGAEEEEKEPEAHTAIRDAMKKLFSQLDALSHYHYTPKPAQAEVKIVSNTPAINMEEVAPIAMSNAALLAPEEVKRKNKGDLISKEERTQTDKKRERRKKKAYQREKGLKEGPKEVKQQKKPEVKESKKSLRTSKAFFEHLNEDVNSLIRSGKNKHKGKGQ